MGKIRTRILGFEDLEKEQKEAAKRRAAEKKAQKGDAEDEKEHVESVQTVALDEKKAKKAVEKPTSKVRVRSKKHNAALGKVDANREYTLEEAVALLKTAKYAGFTESFELHLNTKDSGLKGEIELPHSAGKKARVAILDDALLEKIENGVIEFDVLLAHPSFMPKLAKFARVLGPKGLMPSPKTGTITTNPEEVAKKFEGGMMRWKGEAKFPLVHQMIAKADQADQEIVENAVAFMKQVGKAQVKEAYMTTTMGPAVKISLTMFA
jgi:large subunit ribosomal protein L1